jgi:PAS domain S-box-containing protein
MSFKQLLRKGTLGDLRERPSTQDRDLSPGSSPDGDQATAARSVRVLYLTGDARESRIVSGAFTHTHPHLEFDFSVELADARAHLTATPQYDALVVGWSVPGEAALALIGHLREQGCRLAIVAAAEQSLDLYRQAGADECVRKGGSFLGRLPVAIDDAVKNRPEVPLRPLSAPAFSPGVAALRVAYAGNLQELRAALDGQTPPLDCVWLADTLKDADLHPGAPAPCDVVLIEHGEGSASAIADVRARSLDVPLVLLVDAALERAAFETFGASVDEYVPKTADWPSRLQLRLMAAKTRYQQTRELVSLRLKEARLRSLVEKLPACVVRLSTDSQVLATNDRSLSLLGASHPNQLLKKQFDVMVDDDGREAWTDFVVRVCAGETRSTEVSITTLDGVSRCLEATAVPSPSEFGRSPSMLMVLRDVSDRKRLEAAVEQVNESAVVEEPFPLADEDVELDAPHAGDVREEDVPPVHVHKPLRDIEADLQRISGAARVTFQELGTLLRDAESQHDAALGRQAEEYGRLKAIELEHWRFYEAFVQAASHAMFRATFTGTLLDVNPSLAMTLGYDSPSDLLAASDAIDVFTGESAWTAAASRWRDEQSVEPLDTIWLHRDRSVVSLRLHGRVIDSPRGDGQCLEVVAENLSAQRALETQLRRARRWEDVARITSSIAADLSHVVATVDESSDLESLQHAASRALALSRQLVAFGRREARDVGEIDLNGVVRGMEPVLRRLVDEHIELTLGLDDSLARVLAAPPSIEEVLVNLTVASVGLLPAGGRVQVETCCVTVDRDNAPQHEQIQPGTYGTVSLTATGWGIDARIRERLLAREAPAEDVSREYASAAKAVGHAGGAIAVESGAGESVTFRVYLPLVPRAGVQTGAGTTDVLRPSIGSSQYS